MLPVLFRSVAFDIWENAIVAGLINAVWISAAFVLGIACTAVAAAAPGLAFLLIGASVAFLFALFGPVGIYLEILARRETPDFPTLLSAMLRSLGGSMLVALGGLAALSLLAFAFPLALGLPDALAVAAAILIGWTSIMALQWTALAIGQCDGVQTSPVAAARIAAVRVLSRPAHSGLLLLGALVLMATLVILLPGPCGAALLLRRAARLAGDPAEFDRTANTMSRRTTRSVLFPWKP
jgi:hypothetical protein